MPILSRQLILLLLWLLSFSAWAAPKTVLLVSSNNHFGFVHRIEALITAQPGIQPHLIHRVVDKNNAIDKSQLEKAHCIVTMGAQALEATLASQTQRPIFSVLIRRHVFNQLLQKYKRTTHNPELPISALYLDQPPSRQFRLITTLFPVSQTLPVGLLMHTSALGENHSFNNVHVPKGIMLITAYMNQYDNPSEALEELLKDSQVLLALPDSGLYNAKTARGILLTAYHNRIPVIAYSRTFVNNGALAAVYSTPKQIAHQTAQTIAQILRHDPCLLPEPLFPSEFSIAVNYQVANSLGLTIPNEGSLHKVLQEQEGGHLC